MPHLSPIPSEDLTKKLNDLEQGRQHFKSSECQTKNCPAPMSFKSVRLPGHRRGIGCVLCEQRLVLLRHCEKTSFQDHRVLT